MFQTPHLVKIYKWFLRTFETRIPEAKESFAHSIPFLVGIVFSVEEIEGSDFTFKV